MPPLFWLLDVLTMIAVFALGYCVCSLRTNRREARNTRRQLHDALAAQHTPETTR